MPQSPSHFKDVNQSTPAPSTPTPYFPHEGNNEEGGGARGCRTSQVILRNFECSSHVTTGNQIILLVAQNQSLTNAVQSIKFPFHDEHNRPRNKF